MDDGKLLQDVNRARMAQELLNHDLLRSAFRDLEQQYVQRWRETPVQAVALREKYYLAINVLGQVQAHLATIITNGKLAEADLTMRQKKENVRR